MQIGDLVRFKSRPSTGVYRARYPWKFEIGMVVPGLYKSQTYVSFPSRPQPTNYVLECLEVISEAR